MKNFSIAVHGGVVMILRHQSGYKTGLEDAVCAGYKTLKLGGSAHQQVALAIA